MITHTITFDERFTSKARKAKLEVFLEKVNRLLILKFEAYSARVSKRNLGECPTVTRMAYGVKMAPEHYRFDCMLTLYDKASEVVTSDLFGIVLVKKELRIDYQDEGEGLEAGVDALFFSLMLLA